MQEQLNNACKNGDIKEVYKLIEEKFNFDWNPGLINACLRGHIDIAKLMISKGVYKVNMGLRCACYNGHANIADLMISYGATDWWDAKSISYVVKKNDINIIYLLIDKEVTYYTILKQHQIINLLHLGLNINKLKSHQLYSKLNQQIINHKQETSKYLNLPNELIKLINEYQLF